MAKYTHSRMIMPWDCRIFRGQNSTSSNAWKKVCQTGFSFRHRCYRGVALVWTAIISVLMILFVGLSLDVAKVALVFHQAQNASDAAALAGANLVRGDRLQARLQAQLIAQQNTAEGTPVLLDLNVDNDPDGDIVIGWYNRDLHLFIPAESESDFVNAMSVNTVRSQTRMELGGPVSLNFGQLASVPTVNLIGRWQQKSRPYAIAMCSRGIGAAVIALAPWDTGIYMNGDVSLQVQPIVPPANPDDGEVQINSESANALDIDGNSAKIESTAVNITGGLDVGRNFDLGVEGYYTTGAPPIDDPLADLPDVDYSTWPDKSPSPGKAIIISGPQDDGSPHIIESGYYSGGFYINSDDTAGSPSVRFLPGIYALGGKSTGNIAGLVTRGSPNIISDRAMFYITGDGIVDLRGNGAFTATEPTEESLAAGGFPTDYAGVTIFQDRQNYNEAQINGSSGLDLEGTLYFPRAGYPDGFVNLRGGGAGFGNQLIGWRFDIRGSGIVGIDYDGRNRRLQTASFLVE